MKKIKFLALLLAIIMMFATVSIFAEGEEAGDNTPAGEEAGDNTPAGEEAGDNTPAGEEAGDNTPAGEEAGDNTPADDPEKEESFITKLVPDNNCYVVDLSKISEEQLTRIFYDHRSSNATTVEKVEGGVKFSASTALSDPQVTWAINSMFSYAGFGFREDTGKLKNNIPFTADEVQAIVLKIRASHPGSMELFYLAGDTKDYGPKLNETYYADYDEELPEEEKFEYIILDAEYDYVDETWAGFIGKTFRFDWTHEAEEGQSFIVYEIAFIDSTTNADRYVEGKPLVFGEEEDTEPEEEDDQTTTTEATTTTTASAVETTVVTTEAPKNNDKSGCKSVVTGAAVLVASITLAGFALSKKH